MPISLSPSVDITERDLTLVAPAVATTGGAYVGAFAYGPVMQRVLVDSENLMVKRFGKPTDDTAVHFFTASNFLSYGSNLQVVRVVGDHAFNASSSAHQVFETFDGGLDGFGGAIREFQMAHSFPTAPGNVVVFVDGDLADPADYAVSFTANHLKVTFDVGHEPAAGTDNVEIYANHNRILNEDTFIHDSDLTGSFVSKYPGTLLNGMTVLVATPANWASLTQAQKNLFQGKPVGQELNIAVIDTTGDIAGLPGTVLERYDFVNLDTDAVYADGTTAYFVKVLNDQSAYLWATGDLTDLTLGVAVIDNGTDDNMVTEGQIMDGFDLFADSEHVDVSLILSGPADQTVALHLMAIGDSRKDCVVFLSPPMDAVVNNPGDEEVDTNAYRDTLPSTSYSVMDCNWAYQYDQYNDVYRWVPCNGHTAGLCARTDATNDPWWSPAGYNRGQLKNVVRLAWNPTKAQRDNLYKNGVNPIVTFAGQGTILFGDKTMLARPSAFDRINVRRLFIVLEKTIATAAKYLLFEFNDEFTRAQFRNLVVPYLRDVQGRRGIEAFDVVANATNNTAEVINQNRFVGDIYIDPARSINNIQLNFIATPSGVTFSEIESIST